MHKDQLRKTKSEYIVRREITNHLKLQEKSMHPNIVQLYDFLYDKDRIYLVLEYISGGNLYESILESKKSFSTEITTEIATEIVVKYIRDLSSALSHCHRHNIVHRDVKLENILVTQNGDVKLCDFGWSVAITKLKRRRKSFVGTLDYLSPEMIENERHSYEVDSWALGVLTFEMLIGKPPFSHSTFKGTYERIRRVDLEFPNTFTDDLAKLFISALLVKDPSSRLSMNDIASHPWIIKHTTPTNVSAK